MRVGKDKGALMSGCSKSVDATAELLLRFIDRVRREAAHHMECGPYHDPLKSACAAAISKLSDNDRDELVRVVSKLCEYVG